MDIRRQAGLNVQRFRRALGLSQEELAFEAQIHRTYISGVERGVRNMTITVLAKIAAALQVLPHQLLEAAPKQGDRTPTASRRKSAGAVRKGTTPRAGARMKR
jgi:transcriptional regulator with XRE-family HTH domain